ncbi:hypothetical protein D3C80_1922750 [compost metagenome]
MEVTCTAGDLIEFRIAAQASELMREGRIDTFTSHGLAVERIIRQRLSDRRLCILSVINEILINRRQIGIVAAVALVLDLLVGITEGGRQIFGDRRSHAQRETRFRIIIIIIR